MVQNELEQFREDALYVDQNREELLQRYPERWVAVYRSKVVAEDRELEGLVKKLQKKGMNPGQVYRAHLSAREDLLILPEHPL